MKSTSICLIFTMMIGYTAQSQIFHYASQGMNAPNLEKKGEFSVGLGLSRGDFSGWQGQVAYSPVANIAVMAAYLGAGNKSAVDMEEPGTDYRSWEASICAFQPLKKGMASVALGYSRGEAFSYFNLDNTASIRHHMVFLQPTIEYRRNHFLAGMSFRFSYLNFDQANVSYSIDQYFFDRIRNLEEDTPFFYPEIGFRGGLYFYPMVISMGFNRIFSNTRTIDIAQGNANMMLTLKF